MPTSLRPILREIVDLWLPNGCAGCGIDGASPCRICLDRLVPADPFEPPIGLDSAAALLRYDDSSRRFIASLKFRGIRSVATDFAPPLAALAGDVRLGRIPPVVTWAPTTTSRRRQRGFDQAEAIARAVARVTRSPVRSMLCRSPGSQQTGRDRRSRLEGVGFETIRRVPEVVLVCDDVLTTGATMTAAADALRRSGAREVHGLVLARTPAWSTGRSGGDRIDGRTPRL